MFETGGEVSLIEIIAVDDEMDAKILFDHFFKKEVERGEVAIKFVQSARACLSLLERGFGEKTLVVTDINMPDIDGIGLTERVNTQYPRVKVFLVSAYEVHSQLPKIQHLQIAEYITKPVNFGKLKEKIFKHFSE